VGVGRGAFAVFVAGFLAVTAAARQEPEAAFPDGSGKETFLEVCGLCHAPTAVLNKQWTEKQWDLKVTEMLQEEPAVTAKERDAIIAYLAANFRPAPRVNVNRATAAELEKALGISGGAAAAIVRHREEKGAFKTVDDLKLIPGIEAVTLEELKSRIEF
jgi:competence protein ComEA